MPRSTSSSSSPSLEAPPKMEVQMPKDDSKPQSVRSMITSDIETDLANIKYQQYNSVDELDFLWLFDSRKLPNPKHDAPHSAPVVLPDGTIDVINLFVGHNYFNKQVSDLLKGYLKKYPQYKDALHLCERTPRKEGQKYYNSLLDYDKPTIALIIDSATTLEELAKLKQNLEDAPLLRSMIEEYENDMRSQLNSNKSINITQIHVELYSSSSKGKRRLEEWKTA